MLCFDFYVVFNILVYGKVNVIRMNKKGGEFVYKMYLCFKAYHTRNKIFF